MLADTRILSRHRIHSVLWERDAVVFPDQTTAQLHRVRKNAIDDQLLRAVAFEGRWVVFDLRSIQRSLGADIAEAPARDASGIVLFTLRAYFTTASAFMAKAVGNAIDSWRDPDTANACCAARGVTFIPVTGDRHFLRAAPGDRRFCPITTDARRAA